MFQGVESVGGLLGESIWESKFMKNRKGADSRLHQTLYPRWVRDESILGWKLLVVLLGTQDS